MSTYASGTTVGRNTVAKGFARQGVAPVLARRTGAAGRGGRKTVLTGIIGKGLDDPVRPLTQREKDFGLTPDVIMTGRDKRRQKRAATGLAVTGVGGLGAAAYAAGRHVRKSDVEKGLRLPKLRKPKTLPARPSGEISPGIVYHGPGQVGMRGRGSVQKGVLADVGASLHGISKPAAPAAPNPNAAATPLKAARPAGAKKPVGKGVLGDLKLAGRVAHADGLIPKVKPKTVGLTVGGGLGLAALGNGHRNSVAKRRYDPEDERRHRQGFQAGAGAAGGTLMLGYGVRGVRRDTARVMSTPEPPHPGSAPTRQKTLSVRGKSIPYHLLTDEERAIIDNKHKAAYDSYKAQHAARDAVRSLKSQRGVLLRPKPAALLGGGLATLGLAGAHQGRRHESRYD